MLTNEVFDAIKMEIEVEDEAEVAQRQSKEINHRQVLDTPYSRSHKLTGNQGQILASKIVLLSNPTRWKPRPDHTQKLLHEIIIEGKNVATAIPASTFVSHIFRKKI